MERTTIRAGLCATLLALGGCSASPKINVGKDPDSSVAGSGGASGVSGFGGVGGVGGVGGGDNTLVALITQPPSEMSIEVITVGCAGECKQVLAIATGGHPGYAFVWSDGVATAARDICADDDTAFLVTVTDTPIERDPSCGELCVHYDGQTATASVVAEVLTCLGDAGVAEPDAGDLRQLCANGTTPPFQLMGMAPTATSDAYQQANGLLADYRSDSGNLILVAQARLRVDIGSCTQLLLAADAAGTVAVGWDNVLIVEYSATPGTAATDRWYYGAASNVVHTPTGMMLQQPMQPTVSGFLLNPSVPNPAPFGYAPLAIDLMTHVPSGVSQFELTLYVADYGGFGSTTEIWAIPR